MRYFLGFLAVVVILVTLFVLILRGGSTRTVTQSSNKLLNLTTLSDKNSEVVVTVEGRVNAEEGHRAIRMTVGPGTKTLEVLKGYELAVDSSQTQTNTSAAYDTLLHVLQNAGYTKEKTATNTDAKGLCPLGFHFNYATVVNGQTKTNLWSNACNISGTFAGNGAAIRSLMQEQFPDYSNFTANVVL